MHFVLDIGYLVIDLAQPLFLDLTTCIASKDCG
jgi:hypothetical protein